MPEYPDVTLYIERLDAQTRGQRLEGVRLRSPFVLRSVEPPLGECAGRIVAGYRRIGKRIVVDFGDELFLVIHLMIAGRLRWRKVGAGIGGRNALAAFDFAHGTLLFTEASTKKRAWIRVVRGEEALRALDPGGLEIFDATGEQFAERLRSRNHTLKRALTDARLFSGIGNAYSDEILHRAQLSPIVWTQRLSDEQVTRLYAATRETLEAFTDELRAEVGDGFPETVTAFRPSMAVHGKFREPCPRCGDPVQRIRYADNETNYCPTCQTGGRLLADRSLSRLLRGDWPRTLDELEEHIESRRSR